MNHEEIRQRLLHRAICYLNNYHHGEYKALADVGHDMYYFSQPRGLRADETKSRYQERIFDFVLWNEEVFTEDEIQIISSFYDGIKPLIGKYEEKDFEPFREAVKAHRAELQRLTESTAELRKLDKGCFPLSILERIGDYIRYYEQVQPVDRLILYTSIYNIGRADGIRAERARRKSRKEKADRKETSPHTTE